MSRVSTIASPVTWHGYRGSLADAPEPEPPPEAFLRPPERVLAALKALGGSATAAEVSRLTDQWGAPLSRSSASQALNALARRDPPGVIPVGSPRGGRGRSRRWYLASERGSGR